MRAFLHAVAAHSARVVPDHEALLGGRGVRCARGGAERARSAHPLLLPQRQDLERPLVGDGGHVEVVDARQREIHGGLAARQSAGFAQTAPLPRRRDTCSRAGGAARLGPLCRVRIRPPRARHRTVSAVSERLGPVAPAGIRRRPPAGRPLAMSTESTEGASYGVRPALRPVFPRRAACLRGAALPVAGIRHAVACFVALESLAAPAAQGRPPHVFLRGYAGRGCLRQGAWHGAWRDGCNGDPSALALAPPRAPRPRKGDAREAQRDGTRVRGQGHGEGVHQEGGQGPLRAAGAQRGVLAAPPERRPPVLHLPGRRIPVSGPGALHWGRAPPPRAVRRRSWSPPPSRAARSRGGERQATCGAEC